MSCLNGLGNNERVPQLKFSTGMESASDPGLFSVGAILLFIPYLWISINHFWISKNCAELRISIIHFRISINRLMDIQYSS